MKRFAALYQALDQTTKTNAKLDLLVAYFAEVTAAESAWAVWFLSGQKLRRLVPMKLLREWSAQVSGIEAWMFDECYEVVGDLAEVMSLLLPPPQNGSDLPLDEWVTGRLLPLRNKSENEQRAFVVAYWDELTETELFVLHKLLTGSFRVGVSRKLVIKALSQYSHMAVDVIAHRLMGDWHPSAEFFQQLLADDGGETKISQPYPFYLAHPLDTEPGALGQVADWQAEWKWDGIRAQLIRREGQTFVWSRGEELMTDRFPELVAVGECLPHGTVLDGEIVGWKNGGILSFSELQRRIGRKRPGPKILSDVPVALIAFDILEWQAKDYRSQPLSARRRKLETVVALARGETEAMQISVRLQSDTWQGLADLRQRSRQHHAEGLMLKRTDSPYQVGRPRGDWWKWKVDPYTVDAVMTYAQRGTGRRASLYTDYTFGVWDQGELVTFAKAYSGLTDEEIREVDGFVRAHTLEGFGPVRRVTPQLVFELAFENIQESKRHKSGIAVRFPRIVRWRHDLQPQDADSLDTVKQYMLADA